MTIAEMLALDIGAQVHDTDFKTIKTAGKDVIVDGEYIQSIVLMDKTGEIPCDIRLGPKRKVLIKGEIIKVVDANVQNHAKKGKKLYIDGYLPPPSVTFDEYESQREAENLEWLRDEEKVIEGKIRHGIVCSMIKSGQSIPDILQNKAPIEMVIKYIKTGK